MRGVPEAIARVVQDRHKRQGVDIHYGARISRIATGNGQAGIDLEDGRRLTGDVLVASVGALPNAGLAQAAGLTVDNGILA